MKTTYSLFGHIVRMISIFCLVMLVSSCEKPQPQNPPGVFYISRCELSSGDVVLEWTTSEYAKYYKIYRDNSLLRDNWYGTSFYDTSVKNQNDEYYIVAWNEYGVYTSAKVSASKSTGSGGSSGGSSSGGSSSGVTDNSGHSLASWTQTSSGVYRKTIRATYQVSGNYQAYPSITYWTGNITAEYRPASNKYVIYEPYFNPSSNGGLGLCYTTNITWGYNSVRAYTYSYYDRTTRVNYLADCYCRFTIE